MLHRGNARLHPAWILIQIVDEGWLAALYDPVFTSAVHAAGDAAVALAGFLLLCVWRLPPWSVVALSALGGWVLEAVGNFP